MSSSRKSASAINPQPPVSPPPQPAQQPPPQPSMKFRFKTKSSSSNDQGHRPRSRSRSRSPSRQDRHEHRHRPRHRHHHHSSKRDRAPSTSSQPHLSPDHAFRESLFDALADDEGAEYWENVYGQPIHIYSPYRAGSDISMGMLERMTDEEYMTYVRAEMWKRTQGFLAEERELRERKAKEERERRKKEERRARMDLETRINEGLRRREERNGGKWKEAWDRYLSGWRDGIVWPVGSGRREDVSGEEVKRFFQHAPFSKRSEGSRDEQTGDLGAVLKAERVRWHPDKVQQRFGSRGIDEATMKVVTAVFQIVDRLWTDMR